MRLKLSGASPANGFNTVNYNRNAMKINFTESEYHLIVAALQEYGTSWMAVAPAATKDSSMDISMAKEKGDATFALLKRVRDAKAKQPGNTDPA
jgi:hypothetical protein